MTPRNLLPLGPIRIGFTAEGRPYHDPTSVDIQLAWRLVSEWEAQNPNHPRAGFASEWLEAAELVPEAAANERRLRALFDAAGISTSDVQEMRKILKPIFRALRYDPETEEEAVRTLVIELLRITLGKADAAQAGK